VFVTQCAAEKFTKKLLGEDEIETVLQRLDRLTQDEARMTVAQTLGVVHGLMGNMKVVMAGAQLCMIVCRYLSEYIFPQMGRRLPIVFEKIWVFVSRKGGRSRADIGL
jgi:hypothetical protein